MGKRKPSEEVTAPLWYVSYGDLVTNMLCFFIMLFAFSSLDSPIMRQEYSYTEQRYTSTFSINTDQGASQWLTSGGKGILLMPGNRKSDVPMVVKKVKSMFRKVPMRDRMSIKSDDQVVRIQLPADILFETGSADMKRSAEEILISLIPIVSTVENYIRIDGHTDNVPSRFNKIYPSNWELSTARACSVVRFFVNEMGLDGERFSAQGYGGFRPMVSNETRDGREKNRRVEIVILIGKTKNGKKSSWE